MNALRTLTLHCLRLLVLVVSLQGCLSPSYQLTPAELHRLSTVAPEQRGRGVRLTQQTKVGDDRKTPASDPPPTIQAQPTWVVASYAGHHGPDSLHHHHVHGPGFQIDSSSRSYVHDSDYSRDGDRNGDNDDDDDIGDGSSDAAATAVVAVVAVAAIAAGAVIVAGAIEGSRFDGYANLAPDHPVLLINHTGKQSWKPLHELTASDASRSTRAVVSEHDGWIDQQERAPLDRVGFAYQVEAGGAQLMTPYGASDRGFSMRAALGYSPWQQVGLFWGGQFATGDTTQTTDSTAFALNLRTFAQLEYWPLVLGRLHVGVYGEGGIGKYMLDESPATRSVVTASVGAGVGLQLDITTRLAMTLRAGALLWPSDDLNVRSSVTPAITLGAAVY